MTGTTHRFFARTFWIWLVPVLFLFAVAPRYAAGTLFGEDLEKPKPEFTREGGKITARLIPRAKSTSILIHFEVSGGHLAAVEGVDFAEAEHPGVDTKDFKSALFAVKIDGVSPGAEATISITSNFFTGSTQYWVFNQKLKTPWTNTEAKNTSYPDLVQELAIRVKDGGPRDSDGRIDGRITLVGGPKDSFWGYALGTLFIRFFGIFLVLGVLMLGMILSGKIFQMMDKKAVEAEKGRESPVSAAEEEIMPPEAEDPISPEWVSAVSLALDIHFSATRSPEAGRFFSPEVTPWARQGRERIMSARFLIYNRGNRYQDR